jgi:hypothetical protein
MGRPANEGLKKLLACADGFCNEALPLARVSELAAVSSIPSIINSSQITP